MNRIRPLILGLAAAMTAALLVPTSALAGQRAASSPNAIDSHVTLQLQMQTYDQNGNPNGTLPLDPTAGTDPTGVDVIFWQLDAGTGYYYKLDPASVSWAGAVGGTWDATVPESTYAIQFVPTRTSVSSGYWAQGQPGGVAPLFGGSTDVTTSSVSVDLGTVTLPDRTISTGRIAGSDRWGTAAAASARMYPGSPHATTAPAVVYVANGMNYPDALAAGPAAILNGAPLLLTLPTSLPTPTANELARLQPAKVIVLGSQGAVSNAVMTAIGTAAGVSGANLVRIGGADRYATGNLIARDAWLNGGPGSTVALIATGRNYPDALAAGPAAGYWGAPVILVDGTASTISAATQQLLKDLGVQGVGLVGGTGVVSSGIENQLKGLYPGHVARFAGTTRYETAQAINDGVFGQSDYALFANGMNFPDALAGTPLAGWASAPLYLTPQSCVGAPAAQGTIDHHVNAIRLMGGSFVLTDAVLNLTLCAGAGVSYTSVPTTQGVKLSPLAQVAKAGKPAKLDSSRLSSSTMDSSSRRLTQAFTH
jgi:putative cell wall-binding protein